EARTHPNRNVILKAVDGGDVAPSFSTCAPIVGDRYLLCSDGLTDHVAEADVERALTGTTRELAVDRLIELALDAGAPDNVTVIVADVADVPFGEDAPIVGGAAGDGAEHAPPDSAAARASATTLPRPQPKPAPAGAAPDPRAKRRRRTRLLLVTIVVLAMLLAGALAGRVLLFRYYYVGAENNQVVIYQGLRGSLLGVPLHRVYETSCPAEAAADCEQISVTDLQQSAQLRVREGFEEGTSLDEARADIRRLRFEQMLPPCPRDNGQAGTSTTTPPPTTTGQGGQVVQPGATVTSPVQPPTTSPTAPLTSAPPTTAQPPTTSASTTPPVPGRDCRLVG
ncbi:MAG TPA: protein phosphatase, partial [Pseudonocardiaceae bacterium]|nr:protein phosphatase [Pseudonocardiaceae bacterium]